MYGFMCCLCVLYFYVACFLAIKFALIYEYIKVVYGYPVVFSCFSLVR